MINATSATHTPDHSFLASVSLSRLIQKLFSPVFSQINLSDPPTARLICRLIPMSCPFERDVFLLGRKICHIPALCKLNPLYEQCVALGFEP
jgi:hypothetical protein